MVAAALFSVGMFASFSIAAVLAPLVNLFRVVGRFTLFCRA